MRLFNLEGKKALVTGANQGLGKGMALELARAGAEIIILDLKVSSKTLEEFEAEGLKATGVDFNLANFDKYDDLVKNLVEKHGQIDILLNNAGVQKDMPQLSFLKMIGILL